MIKKAIKEYRELDQAGLVAEIAKLKQEYRLAKETVRLGKEKNHASLKFLKRDIARAQTVLKMKEDQ